jgi:predicted metallo-beta-lactamase superfamily hydrolase
MNRQTNPLKQIQITPLASESFGVRSMCTLVQTPDITILLDAGISLCPWRFNLPPHPIEFQTIQTLREKIANTADKAHIITLSHYHYDHHTPSFEDWIVNWTTQSETARRIYQDKILLIKNPEVNINTSQRERAEMFLKTGAKHAKEVHIADDRVFKYGNTQVYCSKAVSHGEDNSTMGYVTMVMVEYGDERFLFAPDVQGPMSSNTQQMILQIKPAVLMLGGPPFYLAGFRVRAESLQNAISNLKAIVRTVPLTILEHHTLRDECFKQKLVSVREQADQMGNGLLTAAEFVGEANCFLEANRKSLYETVPPSKKFQLWMNALRNNVVSKPPV